ncbi:MAG: holo-ACP synthase [Alphaproteobacteria bacterium]|nr:holo-ACP synthase [Alphaproteobacteria bacterium]
MILGIGCDIVDIKRIKHIYEKEPKRFVERILTSEETGYLKNLSNEKLIVSFIAKRFAAKEAIAKAFGCGICAELSFLDICIKNNNLGAPIVEMMKIPSFVKKGGNIKIHISLSDEDKFATAFAVVELV